VAQSNTPRKQIQLLSRKKLSSQKVGGISAVGEKIYTCTITLLIYVCH